MNRSPSIRLTPDQLAVLLANGAVETTFRGQRCPARGESYPVLLQEPTEVRAIVTGSSLRPRSKRVWTLSVVLDNADAPLLLNAESGGGVIVPLSTGAADTALAHGYIDTPGSKVLDAGEAVPHEDVVTSSQSQEAARKYAAETVDVLAKRRARSLSNRVHNALMQARAHGADPDAEALEEWVERCEEAAKRAAA